MAAMTEPRVIRFDRVEMAFKPQPWPFAEARRGEIAAHFAEVQRERPAIWNGQVLMLREHRIDDGVFRGSFLQTDYASFRAWHDWGYPDTSVTDCFAQGALCSADGAFLLGVMGEHTANAGRIYFPSGTPDLSDVADGAVDFDGSVWRELEEETGLGPQDVTAEPGWHSVLAWPCIAHLRVLHSRDNADALRARILDFLAREEKPELVDIRIVRDTSGLDPMMPEFIRAFLAQMLSLR
jgi:hypothetical protein